MCFFISCSSIFVFTTIFVKQTGYDVFEIDNQTKEDTFLYRHNNADGQDLLFNEYTEQGKDLVKVYPKLSGKHFVAANIVSLIFCLMLLIGTIYNSVWEIANQDMLKVKNGNLKENKANGLIIGALASIPTFITYIVLLLSKANIFSNRYLSAYAVLNSHFYGFIQVVYKNAVTTADLNFVQVLLLFVPVLALPVICSVAYWFGYKDIMLLNKLIYKKKS